MYSILISCRNHSRFRLNTEILTVSMYLGFAKAEKAAQKPPTLNWESCQFVIWGSVACWPLVVKLVSLSRLPLPLLPSWENSIKATDDGTTDLTRHEDTTSATSWDKPARQCLSKSTKITTNIETAMLSNQLRHKQKHVWPLTDCWGKYKISFRCRRVP